MFQTHAPRSPEDVRRFFTVWTETANEADWGAFDELLHPDVVVHDPMDPVPARGRLEALARVRRQYEPFPDGHIDATLFFDTTDVARQVLAAPPAGSSLELGIVLLQRLRAGMRRRRR